MGLSVGFDSSLRYWLTKTADEALPEPAGSAAIARATAGLREARAESLPFEPQRRPLHLLVPDRRLGHRMDGAVAHVISRPLPESSLCHLSGDNTIASPELTYAQMATSEPFLETVRIGCYLCSTFSIGDDGRDYVGERGQLTTVEALRDYVDRLPPGTRGGCDGLARRSRMSSTAWRRRWRSSSEWGTGCRRTWEGWGPLSCTPTRGSRSTSRYRSSSAPAFSRAISTCPSSAPTSNTTAAGSIQANIVLTTRRHEETQSRPWGSRPYRRPMAR